MAPFSSLCLVASCGLLTVGGAVADNVKIEVDTTSPAESISRGLFGHNLEFTRHDLFAGLSAQLVANRKFVLTPNGTKWPYAWDNDRSFPPRWSPVGSASFVQPGYAGPHSSAIHCVVEGNGEACGVTQGTVGEGFNSGMGGGSAIPLQAGATYTARLTVRANSEKPAPVSFAVGQGVENSSILTTFMVPSDGKWHTMEANITAGYGIAEATLAVSIQDAGEFWIGAVSLMPADNFLGLRRDVIARLREIGFGGTLRFPGGCFAPFYSWHDSLLPSDARPPALTPPGYCAAVQGGVNTYTDGAEQDGLSTDEFMVLCQELGMLPSLTLALQFGTDEEIENARAWAEYVNGASDTPMGALRASRGYQEPFNVQHWYLGNEINLQDRYHNYPDDTSSVPHPSAEEYAPIAASAAKAVTASPPDGPLHLFFVGSGQAKWDGPVQRALPLGPHYSTSLHGGYDDQSALATPDDYTQAAREGATKLLAGMRDMHAELNSTVTISTDEWGYGPPWKVSHFGVAHAMYAAALVGSVVRNAAEFGVEFSNYFEVINEGGISVQPFSAELDPIGELFARYSKHQGRFRLPVTSSDTDVDTIASLDADDVLLTIANFDAAQGRTVALSVAGVASQPAQAEVLAAEALAPDAAFNKSTEELSWEAGALTLNLPAYAVAHIRVPLAAAFLV